MIHTDLLTKKMSEVIGENEAKALYEELYKQLPRKKKSINVGKNICKSSDTEKYVYELKDNKYIETVFIKRRDGGTVCVSTQVGIDIRIANIVRNRTTDYIVASKSKPYRFYGYGRAFIQL